MKLLKALLLSSTGPQQGAPRPAAPAGACSSRGQRALIEKLRRPCSCQGKRRTRAKANDGRARSSCYTAFQAPPEFEKLVEWRTSFQALHKLDQDRMALKGETRLCLRSVPLTLIFLPRKTAQIISVGKQSLLTVQHWYSTATEYIITCTHKSCVAASCYQCVPSYSRSCTTLR